jgi:hypothetical protein
MAWCDEGPILLGHGIDVASPRSGNELSSIVLDDETLRYRAHFSWLYYAAAWEG